MPCLLAPTALFRRPYYSLQFSPLYLIQEEMQEAEAPTSTSKSVASQTSIKEEDHYFCPRCSPSSEDEPCCIKPSVSPVTSDRPRRNLLAAVDQLLGLYKRQEVELGDEADVDDVNQDSDRDSGTGSVECVAASPQSLLLLQENDAAC